MAKISYQELREVDLTRLTGAGDDWKTTARDLARLAGDAQNGLKTKSEAAGWSGVNADVTRPFVRKIADEVGDLRKEAGTVGQLLQGAAEQLSDLQEKVEEQHRKAAKHKVEIVDVGDGTVYCQFLDGSGGGPLAPRQDDGVTAPEYLDSSKHTAAEHLAKQDIEKTVNNLLARAASIDHDVSEFLADAHGDDPYDAGHKTYNSLSDAEGKKAASFAEESMAKQARGEELSPTKLNELNDTLKYHAKDPEFATTFYKKLGPEAALRFQAQLALDASAGDGTSTRLAHSIQTHMGTALAAATREREGQPHLSKAWVDQLQKVGRSELDLKYGNPEMPRSGQFGYQVLGNILRHGRYDPAFLNTVGKDMLTFERQNEGGAGPWARPGPLHPDDRLFLGKNGDAGYDPMTGLMEALGHSPEAATDFFNDSTGGGQTGVDRKSNFAYFLGDQKGEGARTWYPDAANMIDPDNEDKVFGQKALGHALEAGVSGRPYDDEGPVTKHTGDQAELFSKVLNHFGEGGTATGNPYQLVKPEGDLHALAPSLGNMAAEYMPDIQRALSSGDHANNIPETGVDALNSADTPEVKRFLRTTAEDPGAYSSILHAQEAVSAMTLEEAMSKAQDPSELDDLAERASRPGARVAELADQGMATSIEESDDAVGRSKDYNDKLATGEKWVGRALGLIPVGGEITSWAVEDLTEAVFSGAQKDPEEIALTVKNNREDFLETGKARSADAMAEAVYAAAEKLGYDRDDNAVEGAAQDAADEVIDPSQRNNPG